MSPGTAMKAAIATVISGEDLTLERAEEAMRAIMSGEATDAQIGSYLTALRMKGETVEEIAGSARAMKEHSVRVDIGAGSGQMLIDTCGTGGDGKNSFNISTTAAFVVAGAGLKVAKHGNRAASSRSGSADVLLALGGNLDLGPQQVAECIRQIGIGFLYAVKHHPAMKNAIGPRRELGQRTVFNLLGPLTNPAGATHQLIGVYDGALTEPMAHVLAELGSKRALVVHGAGGLDELSTAGANQVSELRDGQVRSYMLDPAELGFDISKIETLQGGSPEENAETALGILAGHIAGARRDTVILNAAAAIRLAGGSWESALERARRAVDSGAALDKLQTWIEMTQRYGRAQPGKPSR